MTDPAKPGITTSEGRLTVVAMIVGTLLEAVAGVLHGLQASGHAAPWFPAVLAVVGVLLQVASLWGYQKSRTLVKVALAAQDVPRAGPS